MGKLLAPSDTITRISFRWLEGSAPKVGSVLETIESPDAYIASTLAVHSLDLTVDLFYEEGIVASVYVADIEEMTAGNLQKCEFDLTEDMPVRDIFFLEPHRVTVLARRINSAPSAGNPQNWTSLGPMRLTSLRCRDG
jgi:hypothetical protein